jgi:hypothetical protein
MKERRRRRHSPPLFQMLATVNSFLWKEQQHGYNSMDQPTQRQRRPPPELYPSLLAFFESH